MSQWASCDGAHEIAEKHKHGDPYVDQSAETLNQHFTPLSHSYPVFMQRFWFLFYNFLIIPGFWLLVQLGALFNPKIRRGIQGRKGLLDRIELEAKQHREQEKRAEQLRQHRQSVEDAAKRIRFD